MSVQAVSQNLAVSAGSTSTTRSTDATKDVAATNAASTANKPAGAGTPPASSSVSISSAGRAALAEATETSVQTVKEAHGGDQQAQRLLAKEAAAKGG